MIKQADKTGRRAHLSGMMRKKNEKAMRHHYRMLRQVSRTFALSIEQLPQPLRDAITIAYLLFRVSDCLEDNPKMTPREKADI